MKYGLCNLSIVGVRAEPSNKSELVTQILYGESFKLLDKKGNWTRVKIYFDNYEGWIDNKQFQNISKNFFEKITNEDDVFCGDLIGAPKDKNQNEQIIVLGSVLISLDFLNQKFTGKKHKKSKKTILKTAKLYINSPYLWGGKTPFGIDCSGFTQMVYKLNGVKLNRDASEQAKQGKSLNSLDNSKAGDLAFFENNYGEIIHVGIIIDKTKIIHAHGKVRIDKLDSSGIFNSELNIYTHKLREVRNYL